VEPSAVRAIWEELNNHRLTPARVTEFEGRADCVELAQFSEPAAREAGQRVLRADGTLLLQRWLEQVRFDVYERRGSRSQGSSPEFLELRALEMRIAPTPSEARLWTRLHNGIQGVAFQRQAPVLDFILDFYSRAVRLAVEVDGSSHRLSDAVDDRRDEQLRAHGVITVRLDASSIMRDLDGAIAIIENRMAEPDLIHRISTAREAPRGSRRKSFGDPLPQEPSEPNVRKQRRPSKWYAGATTDERRARTADDRRLRDATGNTVGPADIDLHRRISRGKDRYENG